MIIEARVLSKEIITYESKYGRKTQTLLCCIDLCLNAALKTSFDYVLSPFDEENYPGIEADRKINEKWNLFAKWKKERDDSNDPGYEYEATMFSAGIKWSH